MTNTFKLIRRACCVASLLTSFLSAEEETGKVPKVFGGGSIQEVFRVRLDKGDLLLESIMDIIRTHEIHDGAVFTAAGSLNECTFHGVNSTMTTVKEPMELSNLGGIIADGQPHLHVVLSTKARGAFGGHLENGCSVLAHAELTIVKFGGTPLARKQGGVLQKK